MIDFLNLNMVLKYIDQKVNNSSFLKQQIHHNIMYSTYQWTMLKGIAIGRGTIPFPSEEKLKKQKQALSKKLIAAFGIKDDPIEVRDGSYVALYVTNADGLKQGRQGAHQRNFVEDD